MNLKKMQTVSIIWGLVLFLIVASLTTVGFIYKNKIKKYEEIEKKLELSAKQYVEMKFLYPEKNNNIKITYNELKNEKVIDNISVDDKECDGFTIVSENNKIYKYKTYIKCDNYETKNYEKYVNSL